MVRTDNAVVVAAPRQFVWDTMNELERWPELFSEYAVGLRDPRSDGDTVRFRLTTHPDPEHDGTGLELGVGAHRRRRDVHVEGPPRRDRPVSVHAHRVVLRRVPEGTLMRWRQDFSMKPTAPVDDARAEDYMNRNTRKQMGVVKERLERALNADG